MGSARKGAFGRLRAPAAARCALCDGDLDDDQCRACGAAVLFVNVARLCLFNDPFLATFDTFSHVPKNFARIPPDSRPAPDDRSEVRRDAARINYFRVCFEQGWPVDPLLIQADDFWSDSDDETGLARPLVEDGAHRLAGAILSGRRTVMATNSVDEPVHPDVVEFLRGEEPSSSVRAWLRTRPMYPRRRWPPHPPLEATRRWISNRK